jgi:hypothetical protein
MSTYDKDKIRQAISSMTAICDKGKAEVTKLVESIIGEALPSNTRPALISGDTYKNEHGEYRTLIALGDSWVVLDLHNPRQLVASGKKEEVQCYIYNCDYTFLGPVQLRPIP